MEDLLDRPLVKFKGVGPKRAALLEKLDLHTAADVLGHFPKAHEDRRHSTPIAEVREGLFVTVKGTVDKTRQRWTRKGKSLLEARLEDDTGTLALKWFNQPYLLPRLQTEEIRYMTGPVSSYRGQLQLVNPAMDSEQSKEALPYAERLFPLYPLTPGVPTKAFRKLVWHILEELDPLWDPLGETDLLGEGFPEWRQALTDVHFPEEIEAYEPARRRLAYQEFLLLQLSVRLSSSFAEEGAHLKDPAHLWKRLKNALPFPLTQEQEEAFEEIHKDLAAGPPMRRLLQGEVGSGKTAIAALAMALAHGAGFQSALLVPTEILAEQHYLGLCEWFEACGIQPEILTGGLLPKEQKRVRERLRTGQSSVVVGTHALLSETTGFHQLGLVIVDEQHRFGVQHRLTLLEKAVAPNLLLLSATPIPRSLASTLYGEFQITNMGGAVKERDAVETLWIEEGGRDSIYRFVRQQLQAGAKLFVVCPSISGKKARGAVETLDELAKGPLSDFSLGLLHGKLSSGEQQEALEAFREGHLRVLCCTSIVEVGVDVPDADLMVVEEAQRFGLSQLHQLRGRIGRNGQQATCILLGSATTSEGEDRLQTLTRTDEGYEIAKRDLEIRGPGDLLGVKQHGIPPLRASTLTEDLELMEKARNDAAKVLDKDPDLSRPEHRILKRWVYSRYHASSDYSQT